MKHGALFNGAAVLLAFCFSFCAIMPVSFSSNAEEIVTGIQTVSQSESSLSQEASTTKSNAELLKEKRAELEKNLKETKKKLKELEKDSKDTQEYADALDNKIGYLNEELTLLDNEIYEIQSDIEPLEKKIEKLEESSNIIKSEITEIEKQIDSLNAAFDGNYVEFCQRMRAMYISGDFNILTFLLTSDSLSSFLTRYEMIKCITDRDGELMQNILGQIDEIQSKQSGLAEKKEQLDAEQAQLEADKSELDLKKKEIVEKQDEQKIKKAEFLNEKKKADEALLAINEKNKKYTEFRAEDEELEKQLEQGIQDVIAGAKTEEEVMNELTTSNRGEVETTKKSVSGTDAILNLMYPTPKYTAISDGWPNHSSGRYHGALDFPCPVGTNVLSAQEGKVIFVGNEEKGYGNYIMVYHGTDSKGRSVVTLYAHNSLIVAKKGQRVSKGDIIAISGNTGRSTGPHLHFELRIDGERVNPTNYLSK